MITYVSRSFFISGSYSPDIAELPPTPIPIARDDKIIIKGINNPTAAKDDCPRPATHIPSTKL